MTLKSNSDENLNIKENAKLKKSSGSKERDETIALSNPPTPQKSMEKLTLKASKSDIELVDQPTQDEITKEKSTEDVKTIDFKTFKGSELKEKCQKVDNLFGNEDKVDEDVTIDEKKKIKSGKKAKYGKDDVINVTDQDAISLFPEEKKKTKKRIPKLNCDVSMEEPVTSDGKKKKKGDDGLFVEPTTQDIRKKKKRVEKHGDERKKKPKLDDSDKEVGLKKRKSNICLERKDSTTTESISIIDKSKLVESTSVYKKSGHKIERHPPETQNSRRKVHNASFFEKSKTSLNPLPGLQNRKADTKENKGFFKNFFNKLLKKKADDTYMKPAETVPKPITRGEYVGENCKDRIPRLPFIDYKNNNNSGILFPNGNPFWNIPDHTTRPPSVKHLVISRYVTEYKNRNILVELRTKEPRKEEFDPERNLEIVNGVVKNPWPEYADQDRTKNEFIINNTVRAVQQLLRDVPSKKSIRQDSDDEKRKRVGFATEPTNIKVYDRRKPDKYTIDSYIPGIRQKPEKKKKRPHLPHPGVTIEPPPQSIRKAPE